MVRKRDKNGKGYYVFVSSVKISRKERLFIEKSKGSNSKDNIIIVVFHRVKKEGFYTLLSFGEGIREQIEKSKV